MRHPPRGGQFLHLEDPLPVDRRIEQSGKPQQPGQMRMACHDLFEALVADMADLHLTHGHDIVIQSLEREAMQIGEIAGDVHADDVTGIALDNGAQYVAFDQQRGLVDPLSPLHETGSMRQVLSALDKALENSLLLGRHRMPKPPHQEPAREWICLEIRRRPHGGENSRRARWFRGKGSYRSSTRLSGWECRATRS